jgi:hypothetical protein
MAGKTLAVYGINEHKGKSYWTRVGVCFENRDGSLNVVLNFIPLDGKLQIREPQDKDEQRGG